MESFYIITNQLKDRDYSVTIEIKDYIERKGKYVILAQKDEEGFIVPGTIPENVDCGLVLGGDGTLIRAIRDLEGNKQAKCKNISAFKIIFGVVEFSAHFAFTSSPVFSQMT